MKPLQNLTQFQFYAFCMHWPICTLRNYVIFVHFQPTQFQTFFEQKRLQNSFPESLQQIFTFYDYYDFFKKHRAYF